MSSIVDTLLSIKMEAFKILDNQIKAIEPNVVQFQNPVFNDLLAIVKTQTMSAEECENVLQFLKLCSLYAELNLEKISPKATALDHLSDHLHARKKNGGKQLQ